MHIVRPCAWQLPGACRCRQQNLSTAGLGSQRPTVHCDMTQRSPCRRPFPCAYQIMEPTEQPNNFDK